MICHLCPKPATFVCGDLDRPMCEDHAHAGLVMVPGRGEVACCAPAPQDDPLYGTRAIEQSRRADAAEVERNDLRAITTTMRHEVELSDRIIAGTQPELDRLKRECGRLHESLRLAREAAEAWKALAKEQRIRLRMGRVEEET